MAQRAPKSGSSGAPNFSNAKPCLQGHQWRHRNVPSGCPRTLLGQFREPSRSCPTMDQRPVCPGRKFEHHRFLHQNRSYLSGPFIKTQNGIQQFGIPEKFKCSENVRERDREREIYLHTFQYSLSYWHFAKHNSKDVFLLNPLDMFGDFGFPKSPKLEKPGNNIAPQR